MFKKILIANRGEIAIRIIRACKEMGIETVAIYSTADSSSLHVELSDEAICIGGPKASDSYLNMGAIIQAAISTGAQAIHPGFGFLSENPTFAKLVKQCGLTFIGPDSKVIELLGNKATARKMMIEAGVPVVPGANSIESVEVLHQEAERIGYPLLIKASSGGGGRGMREVHDPKDLEKMYYDAKSEAKACFNDDEVYLEKLIVNPKHIEFQIIGDSKGNVVHLNERDCSIQRRHQKMIEEAPSKILNETLRKQMGESACQAAKALGYENAGTVEFVVDKDGHYYFIEMNTRIQVEHPITEMITGIDLIKTQIKVAQGLALPFTQEEVSINGYAIECRINAENPQKNFAPCPGKITSLHLPGGFGVRIDTLLYQGYMVSSHYDSMIAKVIVHAPTRLEAIRKMRRVLSELVIDGIETNQKLLFYIMHHPEYVKGDFDTSFIEKHLDEMVIENG